MKYSVGDFVRLKTDRDNQKRMITGITERPGFKIYLVSCGTVEGSHYDIELEPWAEEEQKAGFIK